ncbi:MAG: phenylacetate-CoA oxygenase subunit PaaJ [Chloroflexi bacterium]|nr:phenylacetate-CoA oxygenase subunit PaaJ [Chloroflexota bacterium]
MITESQIIAALQDVHDPEIPTLSVVELGLIADVQVDENSVRVKMTPTFAGCPAVEMMRGAMEERLRQLGLADVKVTITYDPPWNSNRITPEGRRKLKAFGLAPPAPYSGELNLIQIMDVPCPFCGSHNTTLESPFGPTLCRAIHYCHDCQQSYEQFKPV